MTGRSSAQEDAPSVPVIFYLFADRLVPKHPVLVEGASIPCTDVRVQRGVLAVELLSPAFWSLRQQGVIQIEALEGRHAKRMFRHPQVQVSPLKRADGPGLERAVIASKETKRHA